MVTLLGDGSSVIVRLVAIEDKPSDGEGEGEADKEIDLVFGGEEAIPDVSVWLWLRACPLGREES
jgi:hypothetical protein